MGLIIREIDTGDDSPAPIIEAKSLIKGKRLGTRVKLASAPSAALSQVQAGQVQRLVSLQGDDDLAIPITIFLDVASVVSSGGGLAFPSDGFYARVSWGAGGFSTFADIDIGQGTCFTVFASSVTVDLYSPAQLNGVNYTAEIGAYCCPGVRPATPIAPTRTIKASGSLAAAASSSLFAVPPYARSLQIVANPSDYANTPSFRVIFCNSAGTEVYSMRYGASMHSSQLHIASPAPLSGLIWETPYFKIANTFTDSVALDRVHAIFGLAL